MKRGKHFAYLNRLATTIGLFSCSLCPLDDKRMHLIFMICLTVFYIFSLMAENSYDNLLKRIEELEKKINSKGEEQYE